MFDEIMSDTPESKRRLFEEAITANLELTRERLKVEMRPTPAYGIKLKQKLTLKHIKNYSKQIKQLQFQKAEDEDSMQLTTLSEEEESGTQSAQALLQPSDPPAKITSEEITLEKNGKNIKELNKLNTQQFDTSNIFTESVFDVCKLVESAKNNRTSLDFDYQKMTNATPGIGRYKQSKMLSSLKNEYAGANIVPDLNESTSLTHDRRSSIKQEIL